MTKRDLSALFSSFLASFREMLDVPLPPVAAALERLNNPASSGLLAAPPPLDDRAAILREIFGVDLDSAVSVR